MPQQTPQQLADYLADLSAAMADMARRNGLVMLAYLFDMARIEAEHLRQAGNCAAAKPDPSQPPQDPDNRPEASRNDTSPPP